MAAFKYKDGHLVLADSVKAEAKTVGVEALNRAAHTAWQAGVPVFIAGVSSVQSFSTLQDLALAVSSAAGAAALAAVKTYAKAYFAQRKSANA